jgi:hypothetical protein
MFIFKESDEARAFGYSIIQSFNYRKNPVLNKTGFIPTSTSPANLHSTAAGK